MPDLFCPHCGSYAGRCHEDRHARTVCAITNRPAKPLVTWDEYRRITQPKRPKFDTPLEPLLHACELAGLRDANGWVKLPADKQNKGRSRPLTGFSVLFATVSPDKDESERHKLIKSFRLGLTDRTYLVRWVSAWNRAFPNDSVNLWSA
jgi:hypothetical protein